MSVEYWTPLQVVNQVAGELGLSQTASVVAGNSTQTTQLLSLLQSAGNELLLAYPWEQLSGIFQISLVTGQSEYDLPSDYAYFKDQTQWDAVNHWPLLGPKSAQEWAWLKNSFVATLPRMRFRVLQDKFQVYPVPGQDVTNAFYMEYVKRNWIAVTGSTTPSKSLTTLDTDVLLYNPWLLVKFVKLKFYDLKGFDTTKVQSDFTRLFDQLTGKDTGAEILSLAPSYNPPYLGIQSIPDGSWNV